MEEDSLYSELMVHHIVLRANHPTTVLNIHKVDSIYILYSGILRSRTGDARSDEELTAEEISLALLPASLFQNLTDDVIGIFFAFYKNASPFPVANVSNSTRIGSPVVGATVVAGEQTSFYNLIDPVTITVRLNPVQEGVSVYIRSMYS